MLKTLHENFVDVSYYISFSTLVAVLLIWLELEASVDFPVYADTFFED